MLTFVHRGWSLTSVSAKGLCLTSCNLNKPSYSSIRKVREWVEAPAIQCLQTDLSTACVHICICGLTSRTEDGLGVYFMFTFLTVVCVGKSSRTSRLRSFVDLKALLINFWVTCCFYHEIFTKFFRITQWKGYSHHDRGPCHPHPSTPCYTPF